MNLRNLFPAARTLTLAGLALTAVFSTGCLFGEDDDDDNDGGQPSALVGVWRHNTMVNNQIIEQETVELMSDGTSVSVMADYNLEECLSWDAPGVPTRTASTAQWRRRWGPMPPAWPMS